MLVNDINKFAPGLELRDDWEIMGNLGESEILEIKYFQAYL